MTCTPKALVGEDGLRTPGLKRWGERRQRELVRIIQIEKHLGHDPGRVWREEAGDAQERTVPVMREKLDGLLCDERRVCELPVGRERDRAVREGMHTGFCTK